MCLALFAIDSHPRYRLVIAANRDEFHARRAMPAHWWPEGWLAGQDLGGGGTWLGITRAGRWALITNVREPLRHDPSAPTRGKLVTSALADAAPPSVSLSRLVAAAHRHNGFNLVIGAGATARWGSNRTDEARDFSRGIHGLSNAALDTPWPKVERTKWALAAWCDRGDEAPDTLLSILRDTTQAPDDLLPATGISVERERTLSPPFIVDSVYGTRSSTLVTIDRDSAAVFLERTFDPEGNAVGDVAEHFRIESRWAGPISAQ